MLAALACAAALAGCDLGEGGASGSFEPNEPGTLRVATERVPSPGFWEGTAEEPTGGFEYALAEELRERLDLERLEVVEVPFADIIDGRLDGADIALSVLTPTTERDTVLDFSSPYMSAPPALLGAPGLDVPDLETARELTYVVEVDTTLVEHLEQSIDPIAEPIIAEDRDAVLAALESGEADAAIFDLPVAYALAEASGGELEVAAKLASDEFLAVGLPDDSQRNTEAVSSAIRAMEADGTIGELSAEWLGAEGGTEVPLLRSSR